MKKYLPKPSLSAIKSVPAVRTLTGIELPNIKRFITEKMFSLETYASVRIVIMAGITAILVIGILFQGVVLYENIEQVQSSHAARGKVEAEIDYWKKMVIQYPDYRDVYYRIATLDYALGNMTEAKLFIEKALTVDPNFEAGHVLGDKVGIAR